MPRGYDIQVYMPHGDPKGMRIITKSNWTGTIMVCRRSLFGQLQDYFAGASKVGVYVLVGNEERDDNDLPTLYIGEGDPIEARLRSHHAGKDFWDTVYCFWSSDLRLNKAHIQYLEAKLIKRAQQARRCNLDNRKDESLPTLSNADTDYCDHFLDELYSCLPVVGFDFFDLSEGPVRSAAPAATAAAEEAPVLYQLTAKGTVLARGWESSSGFTVQKDSRMVKDSVPSITRDLVQQRYNLIDKGVVVPDSMGLYYYFTQDYAFTSPSTAAGVMLGRTANGRIEWKDAQGKTLKQYQTEAAGAVNS